jgi:hypothetical protein
MVATNKSSSARVLECSVLTTITITIGKKGFDNHPLGLPSAAPAVTLPAVNVSSGLMV